VDRDEMLRVPRASSERASTTSARRTCSATLQLFARSPRTRRTKPLDSRCAGDRGDILRDLSDVVGTWKREAAVDAALAAQDRVDEDLWK